MDDFCIIPHMTIRLTDLQLLEVQAEHFRGQILEDHYSLKHK